MEPPETAIFSPSVDGSLGGQKLCIPDLRPAFAAWKKGVNPLHAQVKQAVDARLEQLLGHDERVLAKVKAVDIGLFASGWFPDASYHTLETAAFYCVWLFLWDDAIDGAEGNENSDLLAAEEYCRRSVAFVKYWLGLAGCGPGMLAPEAPTTVCESFAEVGRRVGEYCGWDKRRELFEHLGEYMEACVVEYRWRMSRRVPTVDEFYSWRLKTSSVDVMLDLCRLVFSSANVDTDSMLTEGNTDSVLQRINEIFSLKKELKDGAFGNLIPITMWAMDSDLGSAVHSVAQDIHKCIGDFDSNSSTVQATTAAEKSPQVSDQLGKLIETYQAIATTVLNFSIQSPRYGLLKDRQEDGSFIVDL